MTASNRHTVHPRWVWGGIALVLVGLVLTAIELMTASRTWAIVGGSVVVLGVLLAWAGGVLYDVNSSRSRETEVEQALHGGSHEGISPLERVDDPRAERGAREADRQRRRSLAPTASPTPLAPAAILTLFVAAFWLLISEFVLGRAITSAANSDRLREDAVLIIVVLSALWLRATGRNVIASALCLVSGALLLLAGLLITDVSANVRVSEVASGLVIVVAAIITMTGSWDHNHEIDDKSHHEVGDSDA